LVRWNGQNAWTDAAMSGKIQVQVAPSAKLAGQLRGGTVVESFQARVAELGAGLGEIANDLREQLEETLREAKEGWSLDEVSLSFSLDLEAEAGVVIAKGKTAAGFEATLTWKRS
jgi:hypothetical protein